MTRKIIVFLVSLALVATACSSSKDLSEYDSWPSGYEDKKELASEVKDFANNFGFKESDYYKVFISDGSEVLRVCLIAEEFRLQETSEMTYMSVDSQEECVNQASEEGTDILYYEALSYARRGIETPMTTTLLEKDTDLFIAVILHEQFHETVGHFGPADLSEPTAVLIGTAMGIQFVEEYYGEDSRLIDVIKTKMTERVVVANLYTEYYQRLEGLYGAVENKSIELENARKEKVSIFNDLTTDCTELNLQELDFFCLSEFNNASFGTYYTYLEYFPLVYDLYVAQGEDIQTTFQFLVKISELDATEIKFNFNDASKREVTNTLFGLIEEEIVRLNK